MLIIDCRLYAKSMTKRPAPPAEQAPKRPPCPQRCLHEGRRDLQQPVEYPSEKLSVQGNGHTVGKGRFKVRFYRAQNRGVIRIDGALELFVKAAHIHVDRPDDGTAIGEDELAVHEAVLHAIHLDPARGQFTAVGES